MGQGGQDSAEERLRRNVTRLSLLLEGSQALSRTLKLPEVLQNLTEVSTRLLDMGTGAIYLLQGRMLYLGATTPPLPPGFPENLRRAPLEHHPRIKEALDSESVVIVPDHRGVELTEAERVIAAIRSLRTVVYVPLKGSRELLGVMILASTDTARGITEDELTHCLTLGTQAAIAIENAHLYESLQSELAERREIETALRESEALLAYSQEIANTGSWRGDPATKKLAWSDQTYRIFGLAPGEFDGTLEAFMEAVHPEDRAKVLDAYYGSIEAGVDSYQVEHRIVRGHTDEVRCVHEKGIHQFNEAGEVIATVGVVQDITERKLAEQALARAKDAAEAANKAKTEFLANMSHDLRTPLNGIMGMLQLLQGTKLDEEQSQFVGMAMRSSEQLTSLLSDLLDLSRIEAGKLDIRREAFTIHEIYQSVSDLFGIAAAQKGVALEYSIDESLSGTLVGDSARVRRVLFNLVGNALKFTEQGTVRLEATAKVREKVEQRTVRFSVSDTGVGIPEDRIADVFQPFGRVQAQRASGATGTGLGLSIVKRLVETMGGSVSITSMQGSGTTVSFELPFEEPIEVSRTKPSAESVVESKGRLHILLAEDDDLNRIVTQRLLEREGHVVTSVEDGRQAIDAFAERDFDCIIVDIQMPVMDGIEATRAIREGRLDGSRTDVPIIALTAYAMREDQRRFLEAGVDRCLAKPVKLDKLKKALSQVMQRRQP